MRRTARLGAIGINTLKEDLSLEEKMLLGTYKIKQKEEKKTVY